MRLSHGEVLHQVGHPIIPLMNRLWSQCHGYLTPLLPLSSGLAKCQRMEVSSPCMGKTSSQSLRPSFERRSVSKPRTRTVRRPGLRTLNMRSTRELKHSLLSHGNGWRAINVIERRLDREPWFVVWNSTVAPIPAPTVCGQSQPGRVTITKVEGAKALPPRDRTPFIGPNVRTEDRDRGRNAWHTRSEKRGDSMMQRRGNEAQDRARFSRSTAGGSGWVLTSYITKRHWCFSMAGWMCQPGTASHGR
ncbi:hypothetical protein BC826DRAFT_112035 [Russula brevipes]|nr:hypothetical protein BC826DRAFT_112035 [Russula brevipes]